MELLMEPPPPNYGVISMTLQSQGSGEFVDVGPVLAATYDHQVFELLHPVRGIVTPLAWELIENYGRVERPVDALERYLTHQGALPLKERAVAGGS